jgi:hypothetical protein
LQGHWEAGQIKAWRGCRDLAALLDEAERFRPDRESQHDDLLDAVVDLWQIRRPVHAPQTVAPAWADPEAVEQHTWEAQVQAARAADGRGGLDRASLLIGWQMHRARQQEITSATHAALGQLDPQFMEIGR